MYIKLNNAKLAEDGMDSKVKELTDIVKNIDSYKIDNVSQDMDGNIEHTISTTWE
jgi:transcriptional regulator of NAD metabolism